MPSPWEDGATLSLHARAGLLLDAAGSAAAPGAPVEIATNQAGGAAFTAGGVSARRPTFNIGGLWLEFNGSNWLQATASGTLTTTPYSGVFSLVLRVRLQSTTAYKALATLASSLYLWGTYETAGTPEITDYNQLPKGVASIAGAWTTVIACWNAATGVPRLRIGGNVYAGSPRFAGTAERRYVNPMIGSYLGVAGYGATFDLAAAAIYQSDRVDDAGVKAWFDTAEVAASTSSRLLGLRRRAG